MRRAVSVDPVTLTVIDNYLTSTCRDMGVTMMTTAYSPIFNESLDFSCVIFDAEGDMLAQESFARPRSARSSSPSSGRSPTRHRCSSPATQ